MRHVNCAHRCRTARRSTPVPRLPSPVSTSYLTPVRLRRVPLGLLIFVCACGRGDRDAAIGVAGTLPSSGPDPVVVRLPRVGGTVRAYRYPNLDSLIWRSPQVTPALDRVLSFDPENGVLSYLDSAGGAGWLDFRLGATRRASTSPLASISSSDGWSIFGVDTSNAIVRLTPTGDWQLPVTGKIRRMFPLADGSLVVLVERGARTVLLRVRPPDDVVGDSLEVPRPDRAVATPMGDRLYLSVKRQLLSVQARAFEGVQKVTADDEILAIAPTPSGDRIFVANKGGPRLEVMDRYAEDIAPSVKLPGLATELRMDPMGRYLLARPVSGDSAWVVAIATDELVGTVPTGWRSDLPAVTVDGLIATVRGADVAFVEATKGAVRYRAAGGASDLWFFMLWNGFRPRAAGVDVPVSFALGNELRRDSTADSTQPLAAAPTPSRDSLPATAKPEEVVAPATAASRDSWTVSFAAVLAEDRAREIAEGITVDGQRPRVVKGETAGTTVYRVIFGPYNSKADAERMGRSSKHNYWVYEGIP